MKSAVQKISLLLIDDSMADLQMLLELLSTRDWQIAIGQGGMEGYCKAVLAPPDLILLDLRMPGMDGFATCRRLKADPRTAAIPVIFLTAAATKSERLQGFALGAVDYIVKPFASEEEVLARIDVHLALSHRTYPALNRLAVNRLAVPEGPQASLVRAATGILLDNLIAPPSAEALAKHLGTNSKSLNRAFHAAFAMPVFNWLREQRLAIAHRLLRETPIPVADIAASCGYPSAANFATAFQERFACSPRTFRKRAPIDPDACLKGP